MKSTNMSTPNNTAFVLDRHATFATRGVGRIVVLALLVLPAAGQGKQAPDSLEETTLKLRQNAAGGRADDRLRSKPDVYPAAQSSAQYAPIQKPADSAPGVEIEMYMGESRVFPSSGVARVAVGNRQVVSAEVLDEKDILLYANAAGATSLHVWHRDGRHQRVKVNVFANDMVRYSRDVAAFLANIPNAKASVVGDKVIVEGDNLSDSDRDKVIELAKRYPQIINFTSPIGWEPMVMMDVKVVEFPRSELREMGLKWSSAGGAAVGGIWAPGGRGDRAGREILINPGQTNPPPISQPAGVPLPSSLTILSGVNMGLNAQLNLLEQQGTASILAEPQLSTRSGYKASFLAGGEFPYSTASVNGVTIMFKQYGIKLDIEPRVGNNGVIRAIVESEVSAIDGSVVSTAGPALSTRRTRTEFNVKEGETIVLSGLIQRTSSTDVDKVPLLGDIPVLGALFRSKRFQNRETELVVFVTPSVVDSQTPGLVDRVDQATRRLNDNLGKPPHLSAPLQPGRNPARPRAKMVPSAKSSRTHGEATRTSSSRAEAGRALR